MPRHTTTGELASPARSNDRIWNDDLPEDSRRWYTALDSENGVAVMSLLSQIAKDRSRAVLAVTHDPRTVPYADRILRIEDGLIVGEERRAEGVETVHELARTRKRKANA